MKNIIVDKCMNIIKNNNPKLSKKELDKMRYGLEGLYLNITKVILVFIIAIILGIFKETIILLLIFNGIRMTSFGVHAKRSIDCLVSSMILFLGFPILCIHLTIPIIIKYILFIPLVFLIGLLAPCDTEKRPLKDKKKRLVYKVLSIIISIIYMICAIFIKDNTLSNCFIFALIIQIIVMLPITYKIFGVSYNNYKKYEATN